MRESLTHQFFEASFIHQITEDGSFRIDAECANAQGLWMWCPCAIEGKRLHGLIVPFEGRNVPENFGPIDRNKRRPRWIIAGSALNNLTLTPSIDVGDPSCWHGFITNGVVT